MMQRLQQLLQGVIIQNIAGRHDLMERIGLLRGENEELNALVDQLMNQVGEMNEENFKQKKLVGTVTHLMIDIGTVTGVLSSMALMGSPGAPLLAFSLGTEWTTAEMATLGVKGLIGSGAVIGAAMLTQEHNDWNPSWRIDFPFTHPVLKSDIVAYMEEKAVSRTVATGCLELNKEIQRLLYERVGEHAGSRPRDENYYLRLDECIDAFRVNEELITRVLNVHEAEQMEREQALNLIEEQVREVYPLINIGRFKNIPDDDDYGHHIPD